MRWMAGLPACAGSTGGALVRAVTDHWLIHDGWWLDEIWRHYFEVETADGLLCVVYCDLLCDRWYLERVYD